MNAEHVAADDLRARLAERLERARVKRAPAAVPPRPAGIPARLSPAQRRLWFLQQWQPDGAAYNIPVAWRLRGPLHVDALVDALREVVRRHEVLRTRFASALGEPVPDVQPTSAFDVVRVSSGGDEAAIGRLLDAQARRPFALDRELPIRAMLVHAGDDDHVLLLVVHHIAADGWSIGLLASELSILYGERIGATTSPPPQPAAQYADAAYWQMQALYECRPERLRYWRARLAGAAPTLALPADRVRPARPSGRGAIHRLALDAELSAGLRRFAAGQQATTFTVMLAAFQALCCRLSGERDVVVGVPVAGRDATGLGSIVGCFVNSLAMRGHVRPDDSAKTLVRRVRDDLLTDSEHADLPFEELVEALGATGSTERQASHNPIFQVMCVATDVPRSPLSLPAVEAVDVPLDPRAAKVDLSLSVDDAGETIALALTYSADLFDASSAARIASQYATLLRHLLDDPDRPLAALPLADEAAPQTPATARLIGPEGTILDELDRCTQERPDATALVGDGRSHSYRDLDRQATGVARRLQAMGAGPETRIGVLADRSPEAVIALVGILRAGAAYVPVDADQPPRRLLDIFVAAGAEIVVVTTRRLAATVEGAPGLRVVALDDPASADSARQPPPLPRVDPRSLAYVIFTSGSTGAPKGVAIEHRHLLHYVRGVRERLGIAPGARFALVSTLAADLGHTSLFVSLCSGGTLNVLSAEQSADPAQAASCLRAEPCDYLKIVPAHLAALLSAERPQDVLPGRCLVLGGEAPSWELVQRVRALAPDIDVVNHYGPTEATVGAIAGLVPTERHAAVPLGSPLAHAAAHLLDPRMLPVPVGVPGELYLGGAAIGRGYLGAAELTAERFLPDPFGDVPGARLYRTGDLALRRADGSLQFLGRGDHQVKVRGYRVELGEIENVLRAHAAVRDAAVVTAAGPAAEARLVGYAVPGASAPSSATLRAHLRERLPDYMVPATIAVVDALPLSANGKVDRRALAAAAPQPDTADGPRVAPRTPLEQAIADAWTEVLGVTAPSVTDDFFALGGHSLLATRVVARLRRDLGVSVPVHGLFEHPTIAALAEYVEALRWAMRSPASAAGDGEAYEEGVL